MFEFLNDDDDESAIGILKNDHAQLKDLFDEFEDTEQRRRKVKIAHDALQILKTHAEMEENIFYPAARSCVEQFYMEEANEEHHVAKILVAELDKMDGGEENFEAKFRVLAESVRHHIKEEEDNIFPDVKSSDINLDEIGQQMLSLRRKLLRNGFPPTVEEKMVGKSRKVNSQKVKKRVNARSHLNGRGRDTSYYVRTGAPL